MQEIFSFIHTKIFIELLLALVFGFIIGIERELTNKSAGLRTHILVSLGSAIYTIISIQGFDVGDHLIRDPARIAAQIVTGIGFIGGGVVLRNGVSIQGLTTAASLWITASIGMASGAGQYNVAFYGTIMTFMVLVVIRIFERGFLSKYTFKAIRMEVLVLCDTEKCESIQNWFSHEFKEIVEYKIVKTSKENQKSLSEIKYIIDIYETDPLNKAYKKLKALELVENIYEISIKQVVGE